MKAAVIKVDPTYKLELDEDEMQIIVSLLAATGGSGKNYDMYCVLSDLVDDEIAYDVVDSNNKKASVLNLRFK